MRLVLASRNPNKARELGDVLVGWDVQPLATDADPPEETGATFVENARIKAVFGREHACSGDWVAGEDSGLEADGLGGAPGIRSARFAGEDATDAENLALLLDRLDGLDGPDRRGRYVCELVALSPDGREVRSRGTLEGSIGHEPRGREGFGYDPVFVPDGEERTVAELGDAWKAQNSHRARAARGLVRALKGAGAPE
ncbi:MAG TPA: non-canonical purine NTP pyrophosphatase [Gaiellaceae bacterium]